MSIRVLQLNQLGKKENEGIKECVVTLKELTADERARMQYEAREDYQRRLKDAELYGIEQGIEKNLVYSVDNAMHNLNLTLEQACTALGVTLGAYRSAKERQETLA